MERWHPDRVEREAVRIAHRGLELPILYRELGAVLRRAVPFTASCWLTIDPATQLITGDWAEEFAEIGHPVELGFEMCCANEYLVNDVNKWVHLFATGQRAASLSGSTGGHKEASARYREMFRWLEVKDELRIPLTSGRRLWGGIILTRENADFAPEETATMGRIARTVGRAVRLALLAPATAVTEEPDGPGVVLIASDGGWQATPGAERWLSELQPEAPQPRVGLPDALAIVAAAARAAEMSGDPMAAAANRSRVRSRGGRWLELHGSVVGGGAPTLGGGNTQVAVTVQPARPPTLAALMAEAWELTPREVDVTRLVMRGLSTELIADHLRITRYTVQDHLKSIFEKTGARNRGELVAVMFYGSVWPRAKAGEPVGPSGWFVEDTGGPN